MTTQLDCSLHHGFLKYKFLIGLCGNAGSGKDTFAEALADKLDLWAFAGPVKDAAAVAFAIPREFFDDREDKELIIPYWGKSPRQIAQLVGTELFRNTFGPDFWIHRLEYSLLQSYNSPSDVTAIVTDVRFNNEAQWILDRGGVLVHLTRPGYTGNVGIPNHASEAGIDFNSLTYRGDKDEVIFKVANDSTLARLQECACELVGSLCQRRSVELLSVFDVEETDSKS